MKLLLISMSLVFVAPAPLGETSNDTRLNNIFALLVAGSKGLENYRHQADVAHAYHVLRYKGVPAKNIIVMMYDDIASNPFNPTPGQLRNSPNGPDYYKDLAIDYRGVDVTVDNFRAALKGQKQNIVVKGNSTGRVLESTPADNIFLFYAGHGATGFVIMPNDEYLTKSTLQFAIKKANYNQFSAYIEACESGSMLAGMENDPRVFGLTASTATQPSYAANCDNKGFCYGDEFSVEWMEDSEKYNLNNHNLEEQFEDVKKTVFRSTVVRFGSTSLNSVPVSHFQGQNPGVKISLPKEKGFETVSNVDVPLFFYQSRSETASTKEGKEEARIKLVEILEKRKLVDLLVQELHLSLSKRVEKETLKKEGDCIGLFLETFHQKCHPLGKSPYLASKMKTFIPLVEERNCAKLVKQLKEMCTSASFEEVSV